MEKFEFVLLIVNFLAQEITENDIDRVVEYMVDQSHRGVRVVRVIEESRGSRKVVAIQAHKVDVGKENQVHKSHHDDKRA